MLLKFYISQFIIDQATGNMIKAGGVTLGQSISMSLTGMQ